MEGSAASVFIDRVAELETLRGALSAAREGRSAFCFVGGEAGIGKSRLVGGLIDRAREEGSIVLEGGCPPIAGGQVPFASIAQALRRLPRLVPPDELELVLENARPWLGLLAPSLLHGATVEEQTDELGSTTTRLFEAVLTTLERLGDRRGPAVLVIEDLHWSDRSTRDLLSFLTRALRDARVMLVATYRTDEPQHAETLRPLLAEWSRVDGFLRVELRGFGRDEVAQLIAADSDSGSPPGDRLVDEVLARSDGNPLFALELAASIRAGDTGLPATLRELLLARAASLPPVVQEVLRLAAVIGRRFDHQLIGQASGLDEMQVIAVLREAVRATLLVAERDASGERYAFRTGLLRQAIYEDLVPGERSRLHAAVAAAFEAQIEAAEGRIEAAEGRTAAEDCRSRAGPSLPITGSRRVSRATPCPSSSGQAWPPRQLMLPRGDSGLSARAPALGRLAIRGRLRSGRAATASDRVPARRPVDRAKISRPA